MVGYGRGGCVGVGWRSLNGVTRQSETKSTCMIEKPRDKFFTPVHVQQYHCVRSRTPLFEKGAHIVMFA